MPDGDEMGPQHPGFRMSVQWVLQHNGQTQVGFDFFSRKLIR